MDGGHETQTCINLRIHHIINQNQSSGASREQQTERGMTNERFATLEHTEQEQEHQEELRVPIATIIDRILYTDGGTNDIHVAGDCEVDRSNGR